MGMASDHRSLGISPRISGSLSKMSAGNRAMILPVIEVTNARGKQLVLLMAV